MLSKYISVHQTDWDKYIDGLVLAYNSTPHETTNITPYRMVFGTEISIPLDIIIETPNEESDNKFISASDYVRNLEDNMTEMYKIAREITGRSSTRQKCNYDRNVRNVYYDIGDQVRRHQPKVKIGTKTKLARNWTGPWTVIKRLSDVLYQIKHAKHSKPVIVHADNLKPYRGHGSVNSGDTKELSPSVTQYTGSEDITDSNTPDSRLDIPETKIPRDRPPALQRDAASQSDAPYVKTDSPSREILKTTRRGRPIRMPRRFLD